MARRHWATNDTLTANELEGAFLSVEAAVTNLAFRFVQSTAANVWTVAHNLGKYPSVSIVDSAGSLVTGEVKYLDLNTVQISFFANGAPAAFGGEAYCN